MRGLNTERQTPLAMVVEKLSIMCGRLLEIVLRLKIYVNNLNLWFQNAYLVVVAPDRALMKGVLASQQID